MTVIQFPPPKTLAIFPRPVKETLVRWSRCRQKDNTKTHIKQTVWDNLNWICLWIKTNSGLLWKEQWSY